MAVSNNHPKSHLAAAVFAVLAAAVFLILNFPYTYGRFRGEWSHQDATDFRWPENISLVESVHAGFPLRCHSRLEFGSGHAVTHRSVVKLGLNLAVGIAVVLGVYWATWFRYTLTFQGRRRSRFALDAGLFSVVTTVLLGTAYTLYQETLRHRRIAHQAALQGNCYLDAQVPLVLTSKMPALATHFLHRLRVVNTYFPSPDLLQQISQLPTLNGLRVRSNSIAPSEIHALCDNPNLTLLHCIGTQLSPELMQVLGRMSHLQEINLERTNLDGALLRHLDRLQQLKSVRFQRTPLALAELGEPGWSDSVESLSLPRTLSKEDDILKLDGWKNLASITITDPSIKLSRNTIRIDLSNLPSLQRVVLDRVQRYGLKLSGVPNFQEISEDFDLLNLSSDAQRELPSHTWFSDVTIHDAPSLHSFGCFAKDLRTIDLIKTSSLSQLTLCSGSYWMLGSHSAPANVCEHTQAIVDSLGRVDGPPSIDFLGVDFSGIDLSPLGKNNRIRQLRFSACKIGFEQIRTLESLKNLRSLSAERCAATAQDLEWALSTFTHLEQLDLDVSDIDELRVVNPETLHVFHTRPLQKVRSVRLEEIDRLETQLHVSCPLNELIVSNAPQLTGLGLEGPWPRDSHISGLRDLRWFAAGGKRVDDSVLSALRNCVGLDRLMLAYTSISPASLRQIGNFRELTSLILPGPQVNDDVTQYMEKLRLLRDVNFDDSAIDRKTLEWLLSVESLRRLALNHVKMSPEAIRMLAAFNQTVELEIAGVPLSDHSFAELLDRPNLERLDYSDHSMTPAQWESLCNNHSLRVISLSGCDVTASQVSQLFQANGQIQLHVSDHEWQKLASEVPELLQYERFVNDETYTKLRLLSNSYGVPQGFLLDESEMPIQRNGHAARAEDGRMLGFFDPRYFRELAVQARSPKSASR